MPGMSFGTGVRGFAGTSGAPQASYGSAESYGAGVASGAFGGDVTSAASGKGMSPKTDAGLYFWIGVASVIGLIVLRSSLPN